MAAKTPNLRLKPGEDRVVFPGDEITENWGTGKAKFFPGKPYLNRGITRQTTAQMLVRFRQDVIDLKPKVVVIEAGTNDLASVMGPSTRRHDGRAFPVDGGTGAGAPDPGRAGFGDSGLRLLPEDDRRGARRARLLG